MKSRLLAEVAAKRLEEQRRPRRGPVAAAQKALWEALLRGDIEEAKRQVDPVEAIRGPQPPSPLVLKLIERFNKLASKMR